ncbi:glycosyltransferase family 39 protein [Rhodovulum marinum]|uniref:Dolichyl-phosphate-mannose-protein mannosyltransferase n=1 Tax=Rhodovulum marinum TaxID=320662 RepID=A0A4R2PV12_9RHOB|nr:glycosyltransferase family 39 protein [Rhodovulum marinum]TCP39903.1 dolichyl-phosphate-mannose-protein mannosyltransferase [Rhodovulum marinum]
MNGASRTAPAHARPVAAPFLLALAVYFVAQVALRLALGGSFEADEAEMVVLSRDWHLAFGSQPPLYNWYQSAFFDLFGVNTLGLILAKNLMLFVAYALMFAALRAVSGARLAVVGALALALIPNLAWWAQRTGSHSIALAAMTSATVAAFLYLLRRPGTGAFLLFGLVVGLGGLAKPNYWLVPPALLLAAASMAAYRPVLRDRRLWLSALAALLVVAVPYGLMLGDPRATFSDVWEFRRGGDAEAAAVWGAGLRHLVQGALVEMLSAGIAILLALGLGGRAAWRLSRPAPAETLLMRAALIGLVLVALGVVAGNIAFVRARWLLPLFMLGLPPLMIVIFRAASARSYRNFLRGMVGLALLLLAAIADTRLRGAGSDSLRVDVLAEAIEAAVPDTPPLLGPHYFTGNLLLHRPGWEAFPPFPTRRLDPPSGRVLLIDDGRGPGVLLRQLQEHGFPGDALPAPVLTGEAVLPYRFTDDETRAVGFLLFDFGRPPG